MPAPDAFHVAVRNGLLKEGWIITDDPLYIEFGGVDLYIDLGAERLIAAEKDNQKIAIEIKSFTRPSVISQFHTALGQFLNYRFALRAKEPERRLYLAVPEETYKAFFTLFFTQSVVEEYQLKLVVFNTQEEVIVKWQT